ncbi:MAG TPA: KOW domain-containing RNA-binding protein [Candidatus Mediterraneibacter stercorigallinarum]|uniref:KOW domain-containing RNA-binding protein n=1 Tax=Candidatus Mediterraneibacter stercorigallinarum TaxID=2838686 RepID=A0A9D2DA97_9FIRM|nr:KOW domain-containing RNA-binding protein [Candidatus Mediterraneibacter stercorigallinarum]
MEIKPGMLVRSKAGRDKGHVYAVIDVDNKYVYAADGAERPIRHIKRKNRKHLQPILKVSFSGTPEDAELREIIKRYEAACSSDSRS